MKTCDVCNHNLGLLRFRYKDGIICKKCYEKASKNCTEPVRQLNFGEIKKRCMAEGTEPDFGEFEITNRIGNYILIDKNRKKICIVNNRLQVNGHQLPEIVALKDMQYCRVCCDSSQSWEELQNAGKRLSGYVTFLRLELYMSSNPEPKNIKILSSPVRIKSFAFRKSMGVMQRIVEYLESNDVVCRST